MWLEVIYQMDLNDENKTLADNTFVDDASNHSDHRYSFTKLDRDKEGLKNIEVDF